MRKAGGVGFVLAGIALATVIASPAPAAAESCRLAMPDHPQDARGYTFRATVTGIRVEGDSPPLTYITMTFGKVYANRDSDRLQTGSSIELLSNPCDGFGFVGLTVGDKLLMSTAFLETGDGPAIWNSAIWRIDEGELNLLVPRGGDFQKVWFTSDHRIAHADSLHEALALVAPAAIGLPDSATELRPGLVMPAWTLAVAGIAALVVVGRRPRRARPAAAS